ncbi:MAG TPA: SDR family oxidoreductase [Polyangiaceae bacterium]
MRPNFRERYGPWAIVTGASSGIGDEFAKQLAAVKMNVVLVARRKDRLETLAAELEKAHGIETRIVELDLGRADACDVLALATKGLEIGLLVNNAGFGMKGEFVTLDRAEQARMIAVNCRAPLELTHAFLPAMIERKRGGVIVVASSAAFQALPNTAAYSATKAFETWFAEGLGEEVRPHGVDVLALCPGPTDTEGPRRTGVDPAKVPVKMAHPRDVAKAGLDALGKKAIEIPGFTNKLVYVLVKFLPRTLVTRIAGALIRRVST